MTESGPGGVFKRVVYHEFPHGLRLWSKLREKRNLIPKTLPALSQIKARPWYARSQNEIPAEVNLRHFCFGKIRAALCRAQRNYTLLLSRGSRRGQIFILCSMFTATETNFRIWEKIEYELYRLIEFLLIKVYAFVVEALEIYWMRYNWLWNSILEFVYCLTL